MADRGGRPTEEAKQLVRKTAGEAITQEVNEATSRLRKQRDVPADAWLLIRRWRWLAYKLAEKLLRGEWESTQVRSRRQPNEARSRSASGFLWGFVIGALVGSLAVFVLMRQLQR